MLGFLDQGRPVDGSIWQKGRPSRLKLYPVSPRTTNLHYQLPPPPPPKPPPEDPPPEELLDGELTRVVLVARMVSEKDLEKWCMEW